LIIDKRLDFWPAMELSRKVVHRHFWPMAALIGCVVAVGMSGLLVFLVGVFLTLPLAVALCVYAYEDVFGKLNPATLSSAQPAQPAQTPDTVSQNSAVTPSEVAQPVPPPATTAPTTPTAPGNHSPDA
jgi:hypothetical protein